MERRELSANIKEEPSEACYRSKLTPPCQGCRGLRFKAVGIVLYPELCFHVWIAMMARCFTAVDSVEFLANHP
jgi:hypothetical protein